MNYKNLSSKNLLSLVKVENHLDNYRDILIYPKGRSWMNNIQMVRKELADELIDDSVPINNLIIFFNELVRDATEKATTIVLEQQYKSVETKSFDPGDMIAFNTILDQELAAAQISNAPRLWSILGVNYGQGMERGLSDLGLDREEANWELFRETAAYKQRAFNNLKYIYAGLGHHIKGVVAAGVAEGNHPFDIAKRLRELKLKPKLVNVAPKIVNGKIVRKGYSYTIGQKQYSEMIARTEASRAINQGRLDAYHRGGIERVEWLSAGDNRVCSECMDLDGVRFDIAKAPIIPRHVDCRCTYIIASGSPKPKEKIREAMKISLAEPIYRSSFSSTHITDSNLLQKQTEAFKKSFSELNNLERKQVFRGIIKEFKSINSKAYFNPNNYDEVATAFLASKNIKRIDAIYKQAIRKAVGKKPNAIFIGDAIKTNKWKRISRTFDDDFLAFTDIRQEFINGINSFDTQGGALSFAQQQFRGLFKAGQERNIIYLSKINKDIRIAKEVGNSGPILCRTSGRNIVHELGHTVYYNTLETKDLWNVYYKIAKKRQTLISGYAKVSTTEGFAEEWAWRVTGGRKVKNIDISDFLKSNINTY